MGLAKYMEDNIEIFNNRMYNRGMRIVDLEDFKKMHIRRSTLISLEEEYSLLLKELEKIEIWLNIIDNAEKMIRTTSILKIMDRQKKQLNKVKGQYIDYKFSPKFRDCRSDQFCISNKKEFKKYEKEIIKSYIKYFVDELKAVKNVTSNDSIIINFFYIDIKAFIKKFLNINTEKLQTPLIQYIRENILKDDEKLVLPCPHCKKKTYIDFNICIHCKYPNEVK